MLLYGTKKHEILMRVLATEIYAQKPAELAEVLTAMASDLGIDVEACSEHAERMFSMKQAMDKRLEKKRAAYIAKLDESKRRTNALKARKEALDKRHES